MTTGSVVSSTGEPGVSIGEPAWTESFSVSTAMLKSQNAMNAKGKLERETILTINSMNQSYEERGRSLLNQDRLALNPQYEGISPRLESYTMSR